MKLPELTELAIAGRIQRLEVVSLEGGFYIVQARLEDGFRVLHDERGEILCLRSLIHVREVLAELAPLPCELVQHSTHDEMCGSRCGVIEPLRVPLALVPRE